MKKHFTFLTVLLFTVFCYSQTDEHTGYYITEGGQKVEGYFKHADFFNSNSLEFKKSAADAYSPLSADAISEYGIGASFKFIKKTIKIDKADNTNLQMLSQVREPQYETETHFLNVLVEGDKASLYSVNVNKSTRYFYSLADKTKIEQLIFKKYQSTDDVVQTNNYYQQQLYQGLNCKGEPISEFIKLEYDKKPLVNFFKEYNTCSGAGFTEYDNKAGRGLKMLYTVFAGIYNTSFSIEEQRLPETSNSAISYGLGAEVALAVPSRRWELFVRAEYEMLKVETTGTYRTTYNEQVTVAEADASFINVLAGPRYNFIINDRHKLFLDAAIGLSLASGDVTTNVTIKPFSSEPYAGESNTLPVSNSAVFNFGVGYVFNNKFGIRAVLETERNIFDSLYSYKYSGSIGRIGLNLRYTIN